MIIAILSTLLPFFITVAMAADLARPLVAVTRIERYVLTVVIYGVVFSIESLNP